MSQKFWDLSKKYNISPPNSKTDFKMRLYLISNRCLHLWLFSDSRTHKNFFSKDGDQLLENAI